MADEKYLANRLKYHAASRVATQTGQALVQALNVDGHTVTTNKVWAAPQTAFANNSALNKGITESVAATNDLVAVFKNGATSTAFWNGGLVWTNPAYPAVKLYENVPMTAVTGSDGKASNGKFQAYEVLADADGVTSGSLRIGDWISPTAVTDQETGMPVAGYSGIPMYNNTPLKQADTSKWLETDGHFEFIYMAGLLTFEPGYTPEDKNATNGKNLVKITAFKYVGDYVDDVLAKIEAEIGGGTSPDQPEASITTRVGEIEKAISGYTNANTVSSAIIAETNARTTTDNFLSGVLESFDTENTVSSAIEALRTSAATYSISAETSEDYAAVYKLYQTVNGESTVAGTINIPKDQFLTNAAYNKTTEKLELTFSLNHPASGTIENKVEIDVSDLVHEYEAGNGVSIATSTSGNSIVSVKLNDTINESGFLTLTPDGLALTGVQAAIEAVSDGATSGLETLSAALTDFTGENAISSKFAEVDGRLSSAEERLDAAEDVLSGFSGVNVLSTRFTVDEAEIADIKSKAVSGITTTSTVSGEIVNNLAALDVRVSEASGNAISAKTDGLFAQAYKAGDNIAFGEADASGVIPINGTFTFELSAATDTTLGGVKSGNDITVDADGVVTVNSADKVKSKLSIFEVEYDGSAPVSINTTGEYLSADNGSIGLAVTGEIVSGNTGLIKGSQIYDLASNIADTIESVSGSLHTEIEGISDEASAGLEELSGKVSGSFEDTKVVVGNGGNAIIASNYSIGTALLSSDSDDFGREGTIATESNAKNYVDSKFNDLDDFTSIIEQYNQGLE